MYYYSYSSKADDPSLLSWPFFLCSLFKSVKFFRNITSSVRISGPAISPPMHFMLVIPAAWVLGNWIFLICHPLRMTVSALSIKLLLTLCDCLIAAHYHDSRVSSDQGTQWRRWDMTPRERGNTRPPTETRWCNTASRKTGLGPEMQWLKRNWEETEMNKAWSKIWSEKSFQMLSKAVISSQKLMFKLSKDV